MFRSKITQRRAISALTVLLVAAIGVCLPITAEPVILGERLRLTSAVLGQEREIQVSRPLTYDTSDARYPVFFMLDGHQHFEHAATTVRYLSAQGMVPEMLVVGVANDVDRDRDLTPTAVASEAGSGGADHFLRFLESELVPYVDDRYRTEPYRILAGASYGGLFVLHALYASQPPNSDAEGSGTWGAFLAVSPSLFWDDGIMAKRAQAFFAQPTASDQFVFLSLADESYQAMRQAFDELVELFEHQADGKRLRWSHRYYQDETHGSTKLKAFYDGLRALYARWPVPAHRRQAGLVGLVDHYAELTSTFGYSIEVPERAINSLGYRHLRQEEVETAIRIFQANVERYPESPNVYDSLGEAYERKGDLVRARELYASAVAKAESQEHPLLEAFQRNFDRVVSQVAATKGKI